MNRRDVLGLGLATSASLALNSFSVHAQGKFPERTIRLVIPYPAGGPYDFLGRLYAQKLGEVLGQSVVVENKPGADAAIGAADVAHANPDGYSLLLGGSPTHVTTPALMDKPSYDPVKDFTQLAVTSISPHCISVKNDFPAQNLQELVALVKANPGKFNYADVASSVRIAGELFKKQAGGLDIVGVRYKGAAPAMQDFFGGRVQIYPGLAPSVVGYHKQGLLRILAVMNDKRLKSLPDVPTAIEAGIPNLIQYDFTILCTKAGTPPVIIDQLFQATHKVLTDPAFVSVQEDRAIQPVTDSTPEKARQFVANETARLSPLLNLLREKS